MSIIQNKKAFHDYFIEERYEAGLVLEGWEVKAIRAGRANLKESYVIIRQEEIYLLGCHISPLPTASSHVQPDPVRTRKLLLKSEEIRKLIGKVERAATPSSQLTCIISVDESRLRSDSQKAKNNTTNGPVRRTENGSERDSG